MSKIKRRVITVSFQKGSGTFGADSNANTVTLEGLRVQCSVTASSGGPAMGTAQVRIFGLTSSLLNDLSSLQDTDALMQRNYITIQAGDDSMQTLPVVFTGYAYRSQVDMSGMPDICLNVIATGGSFAAIKPVPAISFPGAADTRVIFQTIAASMALQLEYSGPSVILATPNFSGTAYDQMQACAQHADLQVTIDGDVLAVFPKNGVRASFSPVEVSAASGMVGYPSYSSGDYQGLAIRTIFNPTLRQGMPVTVKTTTPMHLAANGQWAIFNIAHSIESESAGGQWITQFDARYFGANQ